jgi:organic hydroperoxide reductase OsmC/OhrA
MAEPKPKVFEYDVEFDGSSVATARGVAAALPEEWAPEHLVLAGLLDCSLQSLRYHARREGVEATGSGTAYGRVTRREQDGRFAFVDVEARLDVHFEPSPPDVHELLADAERDCFVGASLTTAPRYVWSVS